MFDRVNTDLFLVELVPQASNLVLLPVKCLKELKRKRKDEREENKLCPERQLTEGAVLLLHLAPRGWRRSLCGFAAVWRAAVRPQRVLGLVGLPRGQVAQVSGVFGVLVGQLLLNESLKREDHWSLLDQRLRWQVSVGQTVLCSTSSMRTRCDPVTAPTAGHTWNLRALSCLPTLLSAGASG